MVRSFIRQSGLSLLLTCVGAQTQVSAQIVCIDPGHPSEINSGTTVQNGATETHIDWAVATKLKAMLEKMGYSVVLTKNTEMELVRNKERALIGNRAGAALMVRLHCDTNGGRGYAVYYPDRTGRKDGVTGPSPEVRNQSKRAAEKINSGMAGILHGHLNSNGVRGDSQTFIGSKQGALTGSIFAQIPVVTVEMVVLSNRSDAAFIKTSEGQVKMAEGIAAGISQYVGEPQR